MHLGNGKTVSVAPSGRQFEIVSGDHHAGVVEVGGGLRTYTAGGREVLDGYRQDEMCPSARGQILVPWPNRIRDGRYEFAGRSEQLPLTEPERQTAIHGLGRWQSWTVIEHHSDRITVELLLHPQPGYPHTLEVIVTYGLSADGLTVTTAATNLGARPCPYGAGAHPYLTVGTPSVDTVVLKGPGRTRLIPDERGIPTGSEAVDGTDYDFLQPQPIGAITLDTAYTDLQRDGDGRARVRLAAPDGSSTASVWLDEHYRYLMLFTGDPLPDVNRCSLGIEPMTCAPNAFQSGDGLIVIEPTDTFTSSWGIEPS
jgi:aldose 1-epimerase